MVSVPLEWTIKLKGGNEVKTTLAELKDGFEGAEKGSKEWAKGMQAGNREASRLNNIGRYQNNILLSQYPNLLRVSRAMSTVTSITRTLLTISNALNISKISGNLADAGKISIQNELNAGLRRRGELEAAGLIGSKAWIENEEFIKLKTQELKQKNQELIDQDWSNMLTTITSTLFGVGTIFTNMINNPTIFKALTNAGSFFGAVFGGFFQFAVSTAMKVSGWIASVFGIGSPMSKAAIKTATPMGMAFGLAFQLAVLAAVALAGAYIGDIIATSLRDGDDSNSVLRRLGLPTAKELLATAGINPWDDLAKKQIAASKKVNTQLNPYPWLPPGSAGTTPFSSGKKDQRDIFGGNKPATPGWALGDTGENKNRIVEEVSLWQPLLDLFTITIPDALKVLYEGFTNGWKAITEITNSFGSNLVSGVNDIFKSLIDSMNSAINSYNRAARKMGKSTLSTLTFTPNTFNPIAMPTIKAAKGFNGIVNSPTMFLAGEAGQEHVSITPNGSSSGGNTIVINVAGSVVTEKKIAYMVDQYQKQNLKSRGFTGFG